MRRMLLVAVAAAVLAACAGTPGGGIPEPAGVTALGTGVRRADPKLPAAEVKALTAAQADFAIALYRRLAEEHPGDLVLGPGSLHTALSMVLAGARGRTAAELAAVLNAGGLTDRLPELGNALDRALSARNRAGGVHLAVANRMWAARGLELQDAFVETLATHYGAALAEVDFAGQPEQSRAAVNEWVARATGGKITELFPSGTITGDTLLALADAVHLDAKWKFPFDTRLTNPSGFRLADGTMITVPTMAYDRYLPSGRGDGWQAVRLPYDGDELSMTVILPDGDLAAFERSLDRDLLATIDAAIEDGGIHLSLPRFTAVSHFSLVEALTALGMPSAFGAGADFSGMTGSRGMHLAAVEHEARVDVDEAGTEAAAASGGSFAGSHGPTVIVNRPFLFVVRDEPTGALLFLGRVTDPR